MIIKTIFQNQYKKIISVIRSNYEFNNTMLSVGNIDTEILLGETMGFEGSKLKWNLIFNKLFKVILGPGYMRITVKDEQREFISNIIENLNKGRRKNNPFYSKRSELKVAPFSQQIRSYSTSKDIDLFKYVGEKEFFDKMSKYKYQKDLNKAQYDMEINWANSMLLYYKDKSHVAKDLTHQTDENLQKVIEKINIIKDDIKQDMIRKKYPKLYPFLSYEGSALVALVIARECIIRGEGYTNTCATIGITIVKDAYMRLYQNLSKTENFIVKINDPLFHLYSFDNFVKYLGLVNYDYATIGTFFLSFYMNGDTQIFDTYFSSGGDNDDPNFRYMLKYTDEHLDKLEEEFQIRPMLMPMLCPPGEWAKNKFGGYLSNNIMKEGFTIGTKVHQHKFSNEEIIYETLNNLNNIPFQVNNLLLNYLKGKGKFLLSKSVIDLEPLAVKRIMKIAEFFSDVDKFYLPHSVDWRSRIYCSPYYLNYQSDKLNSSLVQFSVGKPLDENGLNYLYIYGANIHGENGIGKVNYSKRIEWVIENKDKILKLDKNLILRAEDKIKFASFCLLMRELEANPSYQVHMPVFFDATCSGFQHIAAIMRDEKLGALVNLDEQSYQDNVSDVYKYLSTPINNEIRRVGAEDTKYINLKYVDLPRDILKRPIMTKPYNVTVNGIKEQIAKYFSKVYNRNINEKGMVVNNVMYLNVPSINSDRKVTITGVDLFKISNIIYNIILNELPQVKLLYNYFIGISSILSKANLPITWFTPSGLGITQNYKKENSKSILFKTYKKNIRSVLKDYTDELDKKKQVSAIIPNYIHSFDANNLMLVIRECMSKGNRNIMSIHDCFGTHPNDMINLYEIVKIQFV